MYIDLHLLALSSSPKAPTPVVFSINPTCTIAIPRKHLHKRLDFELAADPERYHQTVGSPMHLAITTRPDIAFTVSNSLLRYIQGTKDYGLFYTNASTSLILHGFSDASYASDSDDRKSTSSYVFFLSNAPTSWSAHNKPLSPYLL
jgi:hypothetical protein